jgi:alpha-glucosidase
MEVEIRVVSDEIIRVRLAPQVVFLKDFSYAISSHEFRPSVFCCKETDDSFRVETNMFPV